jgi:hypothetical protein
MSRSTPSSFRVTLATALNLAIASPYGRSSATLGSSVGCGVSAKAAGACDARSVEPSS